MGLMEKIFGDLDEKEVKKVSKIADKVMAYEKEMEALTDDQLCEKTAEFKSASRGTESRWTIYCLRHSPYAGKVHGEVWA